MATYRDVIVLDGKKNRSPTWAYFDVKDEEKKIATCNVCQETYSFRTSVTNLAKHLKNKHNLVLLKKHGDDGVKEYEVQAVQDTAVNSNKQRNSYTEDKVAWDYFNIKNVDKKLASCTLCEETLNYDDNQKHLTNHLLLAHSVNVNNDMDGKEKEDTSIECEEINEETSEEIAVNIWEYFDRKNETLEVAFCSLCEEGISYRDSMDKMLEHLTLKHDISQSPEEVQNSESDLETREAPKENRRVRSIAWEYFDVHSRTNKIATCKICGTFCSFRTSVTNLMKHARRHHNIQRRKSPGPPVQIRPDPTSPKVKHYPHSKLWVYFKCLNGSRKIAMCLVCKKRLSYATSITNLKRHLCRKHPLMAADLAAGNLDGVSESKRILVATGDHIYELETKAEEDSSQDSEQEENVEAMETIYLDEYDDSKRKRLGDEPKPNTRPRKNLSSKREFNESFTNVTDRSEINGASNSLDHFGPYIVSLLKQLPKKVSNRLQADFVRRVIEAQIADDITAATDTVTSNQSCDALAPNDAGIGGDN